MELRIRYLVSQHGCKDETTQFNPSGAGAVGPAGVPMVNQGGSGPTHLGSCSTTTTAPFYRRENKGPAVGK